MRIHLFAATTLCLLLLAPAQARAQEGLAGAATAMSVDSTMGAAQLGAGQQQVNRAQGIATAQTPATPGTGAPQPAAATPGAAPAAAGASTAPSSAPGQTAAAKPPNPTAPAPADISTDVYAPFLRSFFFTPQDMLAIRKALLGQQQALAQQSSGQQQVIPPIRRINLSGIIYKSPQEWLIWINCQKVAPHLLLNEIEEIKVQKDLVFLKWFDIGANKVLEIPPMRPHQTYDIVTGVLMPQQSCNPNGGGT